MPEYPSSGGSGGLAVAGHTANSVPVAGPTLALADLAMGASTILARLAAGNIVAATPAQLKTLLAIAEGDVTGLTADLATLAAAVAAKADAAATAAALALLAPLAGPTFTGVATAPSVSATGKTGATAQAAILAGGTASGAPTTGAHVVGELVVDATGAAWYCTVAGTPGTWVQLGAHSSLIASTSYAAGADAGIALAVGAGFADVDAANLVVPFTVPPSGAVLAALTSYSASITGNLYWNLRDGSGDLAGTSAFIAIAGIDMRRTHRVKKTGLTPGQALSWKWGARVASGSGNVYTGPGYGAAVMEIWAA